MSSGRACLDHYQENGDDLVLATRRWYPTLIQKQNKNAVNFTEIGKALSVSISKLKHVG